MASNGESNESAPPRPLFSVGTGGCPMGYGYGNEIVISLGLLTVNKPLCKIALYLLERAIKRSYFLNLE